MADLEVCNGGRVVQNIALKKVVTLVSEEENFTTCAKQLDHDITHTMISHSMIYSVMTFALR